MPRPDQDAAEPADVDEQPTYLVGEIVRGVVHAYPRPWLSHVRAVDNVLDEIRRPFDRGRNGPGGWWVLSRAALSVVDHLLVPDLAGWRRERMPELPSTAYGEVVPDWVCEVLSPSTEDLDRGEKMEVYGQLGVGHVWLVDPDARTLEVYVNDHHSLRQVGSPCSENDLVKVPPFDSIKLDLSAWWG